MEQIIIIFEILLAFAAGASLCLGIFFMLIDKNASNAKIVSNCFAISGLCFLLWYVPNIYYSTADLSGIDFRKNVEFLIIGIMLLTGQYIVRLKNK